MSRLLTNNIDFHTAAVTQVPVDAYLLDAAGDYNLEGSGAIEKYTNTTVILRDESGKLTHYIRELTRFQTKETPTNGD